ncbi:unnamed protein product, partial [Staurois parvus]
PPVAETWLVTRLLSIRCPVPFCLCFYRPGLPDYATRLPASSHQALFRYIPPAVPSTTVGCTQGSQPGLSLLQVHPHHQGPW